MFNEEFYPTPKGIAKRMIYPFLQDSRRYEKCLRGLSILEPSAGKGDLLDGIFQESNPDAEWNKRKYDSVEARDCKIYCIEQNKELQHILRGKGYKVIAEDFLNFHTDLYFDLIVMNPPFSNGDQHLLKAWELLHEGHIVCLLNSETLNNPYTERRKLLKHIVDAYGTVEELGPVFKNAERPTDVNVSLIRLKKVADKKPLHFEFEERTKERAFKIDDTNIKDAPAVKDIIGNMLIQFDKVKEGFVEFMKMHEQLRHYGDPLIKKVTYFGDGQPQPQIDIMSIALDAMKEAGSTGKKMAFNHFVDNMRSQMWQVVFDHLGKIASFDIEKLMTHNIRTNWETFTKSQGCMDFTRENVWSVIEMLGENKNTILERAITDVFDIFTKYYDENRSYVEGWKTNDKWKVNKKIILPGWLRMSWEKPADRMRFGATYEMSYSHRSEYSDIDKALCFISGKEINHITTIYDALHMSFKRQGKIFKGPHKAETESTFFNIKYFMKGTVHLEFKSEWLWQEFNMRACNGKNWLPESEKQEWEMKKAAEEAAKSYEGPTRQLRLIA